MKGVAAALALVGLALLPQRADALSKDDIIELCNGFPGNTIRIGVVTKGNLEKTLARWPATFETYLQEELADYGCNTTMVPLDFDVITPYTRDQEIDFIFPNPSAFVDLKEQFGINEFVSVKRNFAPQGSNETQELDQFGGVVVRAADRYTNINTFADLKANPQTMRVCAVKGGAFGGWHIQWYEMLKAQIDVDTHFGTGGGDHAAFLANVADEAANGSDAKVGGVYFIGNHELALQYTMVNRTCDIGIARTETIEGQVEDGVYTFNDVYTISDKQVELGFPQYISTPLYPEWPLARLAHVPVDMEQVLSIPLLSMDKESEPAVIGKHAGFGFPYSYEPVREMSIALEIFDCDLGYERQAEFPKQCDACEPGYYGRVSPVTGLRICSPCPVGTYTAQGATASTMCMACEDGETTSSEGSVEGACTQEPYDFTTIAMFIAVPVAFVIAMMSLNILWLRCVLKRQMTISETFQHIFQMFKSMGKFAFGCADLITDIIVVVNALRNDSYAAYHQAYWAIGCLAFVASAIDLYISVAIYHTTMQYLAGDHEKITQKVQKSMKGYQRRGSLRAPDSPMGSQVAVEVAQMDHRRVWNLLLQKLLMQEKGTAGLLLLVEDIPMICMALVVAGLEASRDCVELPGGLIVFLVSFGASCLFGGHRFFIASGFFGQVGKYDRAFAKAVGVPAKLSSSNNGAMPVYSDDDFSGELRLVSSVSPKGSAARGSAKVRPLVGGDEGKHGKQ
mmetsp:Transcript_18159/g.55511  ORF Transcript_18159/g.55511 Transcript_18159/m.55511 type:complete len:737 (-) Transcript_18159:316-2526(-)|eukprot:CAMPEP_0118856880 /NCGR_PEP_ID=MMETSP1163-20130328/4193_1 /TAXON_ID=124430 /ORGANISM="Phaeomonas parva, Strain CCMP2877" /LENGTH=736 /DNA_ID=CAMNT_0006790075 /DNA_START=312 /DNA_END=2522 /DNA_ORIENTATION=-